MFKYLAPLFAGIMLISFAAPASAQGMSYSYSHWYRGDGPWWQTPAQNIRRSQHYDRLLQVNLRFRRYRMMKECGPIGDPQLHASCIASFDAYEPVAYGWGWHPWHRYYHRHWRRMYR